MRRRSEVAAASAPLKQAMDEEQAKEVREEAWGNANAATEQPPSGDFGALIETLFVRDVKGTYRRLQDALIVGDKRTDYGSVMKHLDEAELNARDAHRLWQTAIVERKRWELDNEVVFGKMRTEANNSLQHEKDSKQRSKMITDADIDSRVATLYPDEYRAQEVRRVRMRAMVDSMQNLAEVWLSRCRSLQTILSKQR